MDWSKVTDIATIVFTRWVSPVNAMLVIMLSVWLTFLFRAQKSGRVDMIDTLKGDDGKASAARVLFYASWVAMSWVLMMYVVIKGDDPKILVELFTVYGLMFVAPKVLEKWVEARYGNFRKDGDR